MGDNRTYNTSFVGCIALYPLSRKETTHSRSSSSTIGPAIRGGHKKTSPRRNLEANLEMLSLIHSFKLYICQDPRIARAYTAKNTKKKKTRFSLVSLSVYPRSRRGAERIQHSEGRLGRPPKTALERSYLTETYSYENRILSRDKKKVLTESRKKKNDHLYINVCTRAPHECRHSPPPTHPCLGRSCICSIRQKQKLKLKGMPKVSSEKNNSLAGVRYSSTSQ